MAEEQSKEAKLSEQDGSSSDLKEAMATLQRRSADEEEASTAGGADEGEVSTSAGEAEEAASGASDEGEGEAGESPVAEAGVEVVAPVYEAKHDKLGRSYSTGKRKTSVVRVWVKPGKGEIKVNGKTLEKYFSREVLSMIVRQPLEKASCEGMFDVMATAKGGGLSGQAGALRHGISRALYLFDPTYRPALKKAGFLTRDARIVERKKYGKPKARKSFQFSKR